MAAAPYELFGKTNWWREQFGDDRHLLSNNLSSDGSSQHLPVSSSQAAFHVPTPARASISRPRLLDRRWVKMALSSSRQGLKAVRGDCGFSKRVRECVIPVSLIMLVCVYWSLCATVSCGLYLHTVNQPPDLRQLCSLCPQAFT